MPETQRVDYHAGFIAALKIKYDDQYDFMETVKELILGERPPRLDAVVLKKARSQRLTDELGCFFKEHNVIEFKGYGDGININDYIKVQSYAGMYMTIDRKVNEIPLDQVTVTILQYRFPKETLHMLQQRGCTITERSKGIYEISGNCTLFPVQIVDATVLGEEWAVLKVLVPGAKEEEIEQIQKEYEQATDGNLREHLADVLHISFNSNEAVFEKIKEAGKMSEAVARVFKKEIEEEWQKHQEDVVTEMLQNNEPVEKIVKYFKWTPERVMTFAKQIGVTTLTL